MINRDEMLLVTNNPEAVSRFSADIPVLYDAEWGYLEVLIAVRDKAHLGWRLLTHPLAGSIKPFQTPYRSVLLGKSSLAGDAAADALLIENSIAAYHKQMLGRELPHPGDAVAHDFATVDISLISGAVNGL